MKKGRSVSSGNACAGTGCKAGTRFAAGQGKYCEFYTKQGIYSRPSRQMLYDV